MTGADNAELRFLTVEITGTSTDPICNAIFNNNTSPRLTHITATASGCDQNYAVRNQTSTALMSNVTAMVSGGRLNNAMFIGSNSNVTMTDVTVSASGAGSIGINIDSSTLTILNSTASGSGANSIGIQSSFSTLTILHSILRGTASLGTQLGDNQAKQIGSSQLDGLVLSFSSTSVKCAASYNGSFAALGSNCQPLSP